MSKEVVAQTLKKLGWDDAGIHATLGNIAVETGGTFDYKQKQKGGPGYGLFQFDFYKPHYQRWLKANKKRDSAESQALFYHDTIFGDSQDLLGRGNAATIREALKGGNAAQSADVLAKTWFKPAEDRNPKYYERVAYAQQLAGGKPTGTQPQQQPSVMEERPAFEGRNLLLDNPLVNYLKGLFQ